jgi:hypothetical protein
LQVNYVETFLASEAIKYQNIHNYCPSTVQPSKFVTFVWDNNDINPETLTGVSMHCTNGIVIQLSNINHSMREIQRTPSALIKRKRSFQAVPNILTPYVNKKREDPSHLSNLESTTIKFNEVLTSSEIDFMWTMLRYYKVATGNAQTVPSWTGFNYMIDINIQRPVHIISYLPAIDQSPTKMETVFEVLKQSKSKAETLGLRETDVVFDQAIYAKVSILNF